jgi:hypothetical protein
VKVTVRPAENGGLATYNGLETMEAALANELCARMPKGEAVFLHDIADAHPDCEPRRFDAKVLARESAEGKPFEWNDAFWCSAPQAWTAYQAWKAAGAVLRTTQPA